MGDHPCLPLRGAREEPWTSADDGSAWEETGVREAWPLGAMQSFGLCVKEIGMLQILRKTLMLVCAGLVLSTTLATAATMQGTVTAINANGIDLVYLLS